jgi:hypothetical protein
VKYHAGFFYFYMVRFFGSGSRAKAHTMKGVKLPAKYRNPLNLTQTWTGRGVDPAWVAKLRVSSLLEKALIQVATEVVSSTESLN